MPKRRPAKKRSPAVTVLLVGLCLLLLAVSRYLDSRSEPAASVSAPEAAQADAPKLEVHFLDIGQGDSALLFCGDETLLIDGGKVKNNQKLIARLKELEVDHLDAVICSHPDEDHCGGLSAVLASTRTDAFYCSVDSWHTKVFSDVTKYVEQQGISVTVPQAGDSFAFGEASPRNKYPSLARSCRAD